VITHEQNLKIRQLASAIANDMSAYDAAVAYDGDKEAQDYWQAQWIKSKKDLEDYLWALTETP
jgi:hypothetical protein